MRPSLQLRFSQQLTMTPQLQQAIRLLQLSTLDLQQEIQDALDSNPLLEVEDITPNQHLKPVLKKKSTRLTTKKPKNRTTGCLKSKKKTPTKNCKKKPSAKNSQPIQNGMTTSAQDLQIPHQAQRQKSTKCTKVKQPKTFVTTSLGK